MALATGTTATNSITASREETLGITIPPTLLVRADGAIDHAAIVAAAYDRLWHFCDIARSRIDFRFRWKSGHAADISAMTE